MTKDRLGVIGLLGLLGLTLTIVEGLSCFAFNTVRLAAYRDQKEQT